VLLECEEAYFTALRSRRLFQGFWAKHANWRRNVGNAILLCLDKLQNTRVNQHNRYLDVL